MAGTETKKKTNDAKGITKSNFETKITSEDEILSLVLDIPSNRQLIAIPKKSINNNSALGLVILFINKFSEKFHSLCPVNIFLFHFLLHACLFLAYYQRT